jgi:DNA polymerase I
MKQPMSTRSKKAKKGTQTLVLLDAHAIIHRAYHALPDFASSKGEPTGALYGLISMILGILQEFNPDYVAAAFDLPKPTYRHEVYKEYKAGRKKLDNELTIQLERARDVFKAFNIPMFDLEGFEADDMLGTIVEQMKKAADVNVVIASGDMDTLQLVSGTKVRVYTLRKGIKDTVVYDEEAVKTRYGFGPEHIPDFKGLRGDASDNIIGIKGIGEKTATQLITTFGSIEEMYKELKKNEKKFQEKAGISDRILNLIKEGEEEAEFSKTLATIRRDAPIVFTLPDQKWREALNVNTILSLCSELEFRALAARVKTVFSGKPSSALAAAAQAGTKKASAGTQRESSVAETTGPGTASFNFQTVAVTIRRRTTSFRICERIRSRRRTRLRRKLLKIRVSRVFIAILNVHSFLLLML